MRKVLPRHPVPQQCDADVSLQKERSKLSNSFILIYLIIVVNAFYTFLETAYSFTQSFHEFGDFLATEKEKDDQYDKQDFLCSYSKHHYQ